MSNSNNEQNSNENSNSNHIENTDSQSHQINESNSQDELIEKNNEKNNENNINNNISESNDENQLKTQLEIESKTDSIHLPPELPPKIDLSNESDDNLNLATYAQRAYLEYALSVVKGRALPDVCDGQKPVQRRILYAMQRMGLGFSGNAGAKPVKCARVVGDVLGRFHPHGDQAAYDALVRMAQDFNQRYPLIDGQGNFGSRDGDGAAAMRYTEARLSPITRLLLEEIDQGTIGFIPNYDGSTQEPALLPARLPFVLLNGASGIAVGLATEIPSHNLREIALACVALIKNPQLSDNELFALIPGPDFPTSGQIISTASEIADVYKTGRGSLKVRARWVIEELARNQWQWVVTELPPHVSAQRVLEEIEELTNPKIKANKKAISPEQNLIKNNILSVLDAVRDESNKDALVRLVFEPKNHKIKQTELIQTLLTHTSLESSASINMTSVGIDGKPIQKSLKQMLVEWIAFREKTILKRSQFRLNKVNERIHILEGRQLVLNHLDEVIRLIRESDEPKDELIARFGLSSVQADDILDIRLRQLAKLEVVKIDKELNELRDEHRKLEEILNSTSILRRLMIKEIESDAKQFADPRRTLIQADKRATLEVKIPDEAITVVISDKGWVRTRAGHGHDATVFAFKSGDSLREKLECRSVDSLFVIGNNGRVYSVAVANLPGARGDGQPITTLIELEAKTQAQYYLAGAAQTMMLISNSSGYGFLCTLENMVSRNKSGKAFITLNEGDFVCPPVLIKTAIHSNQNSNHVDLLIEENQKSALTNHLSNIICISENGRVLTFLLSELKMLEKGGRGLQLIDLDKTDRLIAITIYDKSVRVEGLNHQQKPCKEILDNKILNNAKSVRGRKGKPIDFDFKVLRVVNLD